jgi:hypothetical protein
MGRGGSTGVAGMGRGGSTGVAGMGRGGSTGAAGMGRGGSTGAAGMGRGGSTGVAGGPPTGRGGNPGLGGMGRGGGTAAGGRGGMAAGRGGAGVIRDGGTTDGNGTIDGGSTTDSGPAGTGPCAGLCANPRRVPAAMASGDLGTEATCDEVIGSVTHIVCGNFVTPRALTVNNTAVSCAGSGVTLPAARNGGWCMEATAGQYEYAYFNTY